MLAAAADATAPPAPARLTGTRKARDAVPFADIARARTPPVGERFRLRSTRPDSRTHYRAVRLRQPRRCRSSTKKNPGFSAPRHLFAQGLHKFRPSLDLAWHASARGLAGLGRFAASPFRCIAAPQIPPPLHCIPKSANCRDRLKPAAPRWPVLQGGPSGTDLAATRLAPANPSCVGVHLMGNRREREAAQKNTEAAMLRISAR